MLADGYTVYSETWGSETIDGIGGGASTSPSGGATSEPSPEVTPYPSYETDPSTGGGSGSGSSGSVASYPIEQFLAAQGTFCAKDGMGGCASFMAPTANYLGWFNPAQSMSAAVDYAGIANNWLMQHGRWIGSVYKGSVTESPLPDGTSRVVVQLAGDNVYAYVVDGDGFSGKTIVGYSPADYEKPAGAVLGHVDLEVVYISPSMGAPIADLVQLIQAPQGGQRLERFRMLYTGEGELRSTGERRTVRVEYDGSMGPIYPSHPGSPEPTTAMGTARVQIY